MTHSRILLLASLAVLCLGSACAIAETKPEAEPKYAEAEYNIPFGCKVITRVKDGGDRKIIAELPAGGGVVSVPACHRWYLRLTKPDPGKTWDETFEALKPFKTPSLYLYEVDGKAIKALAPYLEYIEGVAIYNSPTICDKDFEPFATCTKLNWFDLHYAENFTGSGLQYFKQFTNLKTIYLLKCGLTDDGFAAVKDLLTLEALHLDSDNLTAKGIAHIQDLTNLRILKLYSLADESCLQYLSGMIYLENLVIPNVNITKDSLSHLSVLPRLRELNLNYATLSDRSVSHLKSLFSLETLNLDVYGLEDKHLKHIGSMPSLKKLSLPEEITCKGLEHLSPLKQLESLELDRNLSDEDMPAIGKLGAAHWVGQWFRPEQRRRLAIDG